MLRNLTVPSRVAVSKDGSFGDGTVKFINNTVVWNIYPKMKYFLIYCDKG